MSKPKLLDLFCGAGGCAKGYQQAGFYVVGVDIERQPRYRGDEFVQADAMVYPLEGYSAIHASPPCQAYSLAARGTGKTYPDLLAATRVRLVESQTPWVIENVPGAPMAAHFRLCGCMFGLKLRRERWFETSWQHFELRQPCRHEGPVLSVVGRGTPTWVRDIWREKFGRNPSIKDYREAMGIGWMNRGELSQAIPPAYCEFIGKHLMKIIGQRKA